MLEVGDGQPSQSPPQQPQEWLLLQGVQIHRDRVPLPKGEHDLDGPGQPRGEDQAGGGVVVHHTDPSSELFREAHSLHRNL